MEDIVAVDVRVADILWAEADRAEAVDPEDPLAEADRVEAADRAQVPGEEPDRAVQVREDQWADRVVQWEVREADRRGEAGSVVFSIAHGLDTAAMDMAVGAVADV